MTLTRASLIGMGIALLGGAALVLLWPPIFGLLFWSGFWALVGGLLASLALGSVRLLGAKPLLAKLLGAVVGLVGLLLLGVSGFGTIGFFVMGASLEQFETPERHGQPDSNTIRVTYMRLASTAEDPGPPVLYLAGGPGGPGTLTAISARYPMFQAMREIGDVIALDQRATMPWNEPFLICLDTGSYPLDQPLDRESAQEIRGDFVRECAAEYAAAGVDLAGYTTDENAHDLDVLRDHLGSEKVSIWATSYGTHLALAYLRRHPERVHRVVLHGIEGPDHTLKLPSNVQAALEDVSAGVGPTASDGTLLEAVTARLAELSAQPRTVELPDEPPVTIGPFDLQLYTALQLGNARSRASLLPLYDEIGAGDWGRVARFALDLRRASVMSLMGLLMDCASGASAERVERVSREAAEALLGDAMNYPFLEVCDAVPIEQAGPEFRSPVRSAVPTLFISGTQDGRTPVRNALEVIGGFSNARHVIIEGAGHGDELFLASPQIQQVVLEFMRGDALSTERIVAD